MLTIKPFRSGFAVHCTHRSFVVGRVIDRKLVNRWRPEFRADAHKPIRGKGVSRRSIGRTGFGYIRIDRRYL
jgi:hypothetical protein